MPESVAKDVRPRNPRRAKRAVRADTGRNPTPGEDCGGVGRVGCTGATTPRCLRLPAPDPASRRDLPTAASTDYFPWPRSRPPQSLRGSVAFSRAGALQRRPLASGCSPASNGQLGTAAQDFSSTPVALPDAPAAAEVAANAFSSFIRTPRRCGHLHRHHQSFDLFDACASVRVRRRPGGSGPEL